MPLTPATMNDLGLHLAGLFAAASLHNGSPGNTGANEIAGGGYTRQTPTFNVDANGNLTLSAPDAFTGTPSAAVTHVGLWGADGTTFRGYWPLTGDLAFNAAGSYSVTGITINGSSS